MTSQLIGMIERFFANFFNSSDHGSLKELQEFVNKLVQNKPTQIVACSQILLKKLKKECFLQTQSLILATFLQLISSTHYRPDVIGQLQNLTLITLTLERGLEWYTQLLAGLVNYLQTLSKVQEIYSILASRGIPEDDQLLNGIFRIVNQLTPVFPSLQKAKMSYGIYFREIRIYHELELLFATIVQHFAEVQQFFKLLTVRFHSRFKKLPKEQVVCFISSLDDFQGIQDRLSHLISSRWIKSNAKIGRQSKIGFQPEKIQELQMFVKQQKNPEIAVQRFKKLVASRNMPIVSKKKAFLHRSEDIMFLKPLK